MDFCGLEFVVRKGGIRGGAGGEVYGLGYNFRLTIEGETLRCGPELRVYRTKRSGFIV